MELRTPVRLGHGLDLTVRRTSCWNRRAICVPAQRRPARGRHAAGPLLRSSTSWDPAWPRRSAAALSYLDDGSHLSPRPPARRSRRGGRPDPVARLIVDAPSRPSTTSPAPRFAESRMVCEPPAHEPWLHGLGEEGTDPGSDRMMTAVSVLRHDAPAEGHRPRPTPRRDGLVRRTAGGSGTQPHPACQVPRPGRAAGAREAAGPPPGARPSSPDNRRPRRTSRPRRGAAGHPSGTPRERPHGPRPRRRRPAR